MPLPSWLSRLPLSPAVSLSRTGTTRTWPHPMSPQGQQRSAGTVSVTLVRAAPGPGSGNVQVRSWPKCRLPPFLMRSGHRQPASPLTGRVGPAASATGRRLSGHSGGTAPRPHVQGKDHGCPADPVVRRADQPMRVLGQERERGGMRRPKKLIASLPDQPNQSAVPGVAWASLGGSAGRS